MKDFFIYFFGKGETPNFTNFTFSHFAPILTMRTVIALIWFFRDKLAGWKHEKALRYILAFDPRYPAAQFRPAAHHHGCGDHIPVCSGISAPVLKRPQSEKYRFCITKRMPCGILFRFIG